jgi:hypothetical protein
MVSSCICESLCVFVCVYIFCHGRKRMPEASSIWVFRLGVLCLNKAFFRSRHGKGKEILNKHSIESYV